MKKLVALMMVLLIVLGLAACGGKTAETSSDSGSGSGDSDTAYVKDKGKLVVGITEFEPMDFKDAEGEWVGFDADMAKAFAESLGVDVEFVVIDWNNKSMELDGKNVDCLWNGMTLTDEVTSAMDCSNAYCRNAQIVIVPAKEASKYQTPESLQGLNVAVEEGSAGEEEANALGLKVTPMQSQADTLMEVSTGSSDAAIIDSLMATAMVGEGTSYADLTYTVELNSEEYGVGFRKGSDLVDAMNKFFADSYADGSMAECAQKYGIQGSIIKQ